MSQKQGTLVPKVKLSNVIKMDANVDMNSIVAYFISKYENTLLNTKKQLSEQIIQKNTYLEGEYVRELEKEVKLDSYQVTVKILDLTTTSRLEVNLPIFEREKKINIRITHSDKSKNCNFSGCKTVTVSDELHKKYMDIASEVKELRSQLTEVLNKLSTISRKERELRGALAEKTLKEAGVGELFQDETLLNLVSLPQLSLNKI